MKTKTKSTTITKETAHVLASLRVRQCASVGYSNAAARFPHEVWAAIAVIQKHMRHRGHNYDVVIIAEGLIGGAYAFSKPVTTEAP